MRFVDRAGDADQDFDSAEQICAEFFKAMSEVVLAAAPEAPKS